jgi:hypothetical protein
VLPAAIAPMIGSIASTAGKKINDQIVVLVVRNNYSLHHVVILPDVFYGA